jgi:hypothetical protein
MNAEPKKKKLRRWLLRLVLVLAALALYLLLVLPISRAIKNHGATKRAASDGGIVVLRHAGRLRPAAPHHGLYAL